jgi:hypothetical protein
MMINSGVSEEEVLNSFVDLNLQTNGKSPDTPEDAEKIKDSVEDLLGQPSCKFDYKVFYTKPSSSDVPLETIVPTGGGDEFDDKLLKKETCMVIEMDPKVVKMIKA